jgi:hypothetical protein
MYCENKNKNEKGKKEKGHSGAKVNLPEQRWRSEREQRVQNLHPAVLPSYRRASMGLYEPMIRLPRKVESPL